MRLQRSMRVIGIAIALCSLCCAEGKEKPLPKDLPPYAPLKPFSPPPVKELKLGNGLSVWLAPVSGFPKVSFTVAIRGGYSGDAKGRPGLAQLLAKTVTQGTTERNARQIAEEVQSCGGDLESVAHTDEILLEVSVLSEKVEPALAILADVVRNATFPEEEVHVAKQNAAATLEAQEAEPRFLGQRAFYRAVFGEHPYSVISPTKDSIETLTSAELKSEYARRFRPNQTLLAVAGDFESARMEALIRKNFEKWQNPSSMNDTSVPAPSTTITSRTVFYVPRPNSVQTTFVIGGLGPTLGQKDFEAANLANAIYGGMFGSRLVLNIREDKGYTYSPGSSVAPYRATGLMITRADVRNAVTGASFNEIAYELNRVATTTPEARELETAKRYSIGKLAISLQSQAALTRKLADYWINSLTAKDLAHESEKIQRVSLDEVLDAGRHYFPISRLTVVAVGEEKAIRDELGVFGLEFKRVE